jgi:hypothetical protein
MISIFVIRLRDPAWPAAACRTALQVDADNAGMIPAH